MSRRGSQAQSSSQSQFESQAPTKSSCGLNLTEMEDVALVRAFISVGGYEIVGNDQKYAAMWRRIEQAYYQNFQNAFKRPINTLQHRWTKINNEVQTFSGIVMHCENAKASGHTDIDVMNEAMKEYREETGYKWQFMACYEVLKDVPKWSLSSIRLNNMHSFQEGVGDGTASSPCISITSRANLNMNDNFVDLGPSIPRPLGKKLSIAEKRKAEIDADYEKLNLERKERLNKINENFQEFMQIKKKELEYSTMNIELNARKIKLKEEMKDHILEREDRILYTDTSNFTPQRLAHHQERCNQLVDARKARNARG